MTLHDATGESLCTLRYGRMPQGDIDGLCTALCDDVLWLLRRRPELHVLLLCEGAKELWNRLGHAPDGGDGADPLSARP